MEFLFIQVDGNMNNSIADGIRTFSYMLLSEDFSVLAYKSVAINSGTSVTDRYFMGKEDLPFNRQYGQLKDVLTVPERIVFGYGVGYSVCALERACERFKLPSLDVTMFDIQRLYRLLYPSAHKPTLHEAAETLGVTCKDMPDFDHKVQLAAAVMQSICSEWHITLPQCIQKYRSQAMGYTKRYMPYWYADVERGATLKSSSVGSFKVRVDFPVISFQKKMGSLREDGYHDSVVLYYDHTLRKWFQDRHPHRAAKALPDSLIADSFPAARADGRRMIENTAAWFTNVPSPMKTNDYIVSYEFLGSIKNGMLQFDFHPNALHEIERRNRYARMLKERGVDPADAIKRYYTAQTFEKAMRRNKKWEYGDKTPTISLPAPPEMSFSAFADDEIYLPRVYENLLTGKIDGYRVTACPSEHLAFAQGKNVEAIENRKNVPQDIKLIVADENGAEYGMVAFLGRVHCTLFDADYVLPLLAMKQLKA